MRFDHQQVLLRSSRSIERQDTGPQNKPELNQRYSILRRCRRGRFEFGKNEDSSMTISQLIFAALCVFSSDYYSQMLNLLYTMFLLFFLLSSIFLHRLFSLVTSDIPSSLPSDQTKTVCIIDNTMIRA